MISTLAEKLEAMAQASVAELYPGVETRTASLPSCSTPEKGSVPRLANVVEMAKRQDSNENLVSFLKRIEEDEEDNDDERALKMRQRMATIATQQGLSFKSKESLRIMRDIVQTKVPEQRTSQDIKTVAEMVGTFSFLATQPEVVPAFARQCQYKALRKGKYVFHEGDEGTAFYIIMSGRAHVIIANAVRTVLTPGDRFGELALLDNKPRAASILCVEDTEMLTLSVADYNSILRAVETKKQAARIQHLGNLPVFESMPAPALKLLSDISTQRVYSAGHQFTVEGDPKALSVFFIVRGEVSVIKQVATPEGPRHLEVYRLGPGNYFGELAILSGTPRQATVVGRELCDVIAIPRTDFMRQVTKEAMLHFNQEAKRYPGEEEIARIYQQYSEWTAFKADLVAQVVHDKHRASRHTSYPWTQKPFQ